MTPIIAITARTRAAVTMGMIMMLSPAAKVKDKQTNEKLTICLEA